ncbi:site-specific integrase [Siccibacter turicensis]|uniref:site-specific integrase n=1 Tax=Siccibacter turicensis TaxID=357233 RepID=UPI002A6B4192|nr:site-specific integrase [Siccibacter turicensis]MDY0973318.1 site-specific integrase [Siccibacter turicensis]
MGNNKRDVSKLNKDYREKILEYAISKNMKCSNAIAVLHSTGCRPDELTKGVRVSISQDLKKLEFTILGSKLNAEQRRGIRLRKISVSIHDENNKIKPNILPLLNDLQKNEFESIKVSVASANSFSGYISKISKRLYPRKKYHASAYSFRHSFAADLKNSGADTVLIAKSMGHASTRSQQSYGRKRRGSSGEVSPVQEAVASSDIRHQDRLLRFKIKNKNLKTKSRAEIGDALASRNKQPATAPKRKFKM